MLISPFEESLASCIRKDKYIIGKLKTLRNEVETHHTVCNSVKTGGTAVGAVGTGLMVASLIAAPFTAGASLAVTVGAAACSIGGAATNIITNVVDGSKTKDMIAEVQNLVESRTKTISQYQEQSNQLSSVVKNLVSKGLNEEDAMQITLHAIANGAVDLRVITSSPDATATMASIGMGFGRLMQTELQILGAMQMMGAPTVALFKSSAVVASPLMKDFMSILAGWEHMGKFGSDVYQVGKAVKYGGDAFKAGQAIKSGGDAFKAGNDVIKAGQAIKAGSDTLKAGQAIEAGGQATFSVAKSVSTVAVAATVASVALTVVDIAFLISSWASDHPTVAVINDVISQLNEELQSFETLNSTIGTFKEKSYLSTLDDIQIVGSSDVFNDALIALLNNDVAKCISILKQHDIIWPFKHQYTTRELAEFIYESDVASGYDKKAVESIISKSGKKAKKAVLELVKNILEVIKRKSESAQKEGESDKRHRRGEHVINNSVISVHRDIIDRFLRYQFQVTFPEIAHRLGPYSQLSRDYRQPLPDQIRENIQTRMVAHIPDDYVYIDANTFIYGALIEIIRESAKLHMSDLYNSPQLGGTRHTANITTTISQLNIFQAYVDQVALQYWLAHGGGDWTTYESSRSSVQSMFQNLYDKLRVWVNELRRAGL